MLCATMRLKTPSGCPIKKCQVKVSVRNSCQNERFHRIVNQILLTYNRSTDVFLNVQQLILILWLLRNLTPVGMHPTTDVHNINNRLEILLSTTFVTNNKPFRGGHDIDGQELFICRTRSNGQIIPGKYSKNIGKCSISNNREEVQFNQFELLVESTDTRYEWVKVTKPVTRLPNNVLLGGSRRLHSKLKTRPINQSVSHNETGTFDYILSNERLQWGQRKRRHRRSIVPQLQWSRNWRGVMTINKGKQKSAKIQKRFQDFIEVPVERTKCHPQKIPQNADCVNETQKLNYFIAKCSLRTNDVTSEQIGKIWWNESAQEWIASFPFGGHEIYCFDYSVLALKTV